MGGLYFIVPALLTIFLSFLIVRAAAIALMMTGLDEKRSKFQALSAFTGTGFTTKEAESVLNNPLRRRIVSWLMIMGNAGIVAVIITATSSIVTSKGYSLPISVILLATGIFIIYKIASRKGFIKRWESYVEDKLAKLSAFEEGTTEDLLHLIEGYGLVKIIVLEESQLIGQTIAEHKLTDKGMLVLGIERDKQWIPIPKAKEVIKEGDKLVLYGPLDILKSEFRDY